MPRPTLTEGDVDRGGPPNLNRLQAVAALAPHLPDHDGMWEQVVGWAARHLELDAPAHFVAARRRAQQLRDTGQLPDSHTLTSWALQEARHTARDGR